jgi:hypothetical protein
VQPAIIGFSVTQTNASLNAHWQRTAPDECGEGRSALHDASKTRRRLRGCRAETIDLWITLQLIREMGELRWRCETTEATSMRFSLCCPITRTVTLTLATLKLDDKTTKFL